jgi:hypothetical protein
MINIASWTDEINAKMPAGSSYFVEVGHNGNGNIENSSDTSDAGWDSCGSAIEYAGILALISSVQLAILIISWARIRKFSPAGE